MTLVPPREHAYAIAVTWKGNKGTGTSGYRAYERAHEMTSIGKPPIAASSDPAFRGDPARWNPEEMLVASLSSCHMLWYLHLCSEAGVHVVDYVDCAEGFMVEDGSGGGRFTEVVLSPEVVLAPGADAERARDLHTEAHAKCFIANSVNFVVRHEPVLRHATA